MPVSNFGPDFSGTQETTSQVSIPAAPQMDYTATPPTTSQYVVPQQTTPQVPEAPPIASSPYTPTQQQTAPAVQQTVTTQTQNANMAEVKGTCGSGSVGNGICGNPDECCSAYGL